MSGGYYRRDADPPNDIVAEMRFQQNIAREIENRRAERRLEEEGPDEFEELFTVDGTLYTRRVVAEWWEDPMSKARRVLAEELGIELTRVLPRFGGRYIGKPEEKK